MVTFRRGTRGITYLRVLIVCLATASLGVCADRFFEVRGVLSECGVNTPIPGAQGLATAAGHSGRTQFSTDSSGSFRIHMNAYYTAHVTVTIKKPGYSDLTVEYYGIPPDGNNLQLCMNRSQ